jgi:CubicO group peptidase (beta-lactamase class C family)
LTSAGYGSGPEDTLAMTPRPSTWALALALAAGTSGTPAQEAGADAPAIRARVDAFAGVLRGGTADDFEAMLQAHGSPELLARRTPAERRTMHERIAADFGAITVESIRLGDGRATIAAKGATGKAGAFELSLEPAPPFRITAIRLEAGDRAPDGRQAPTSIALRPDMDAAAMARVLDAHLHPLVAGDAFAGVVLVARDGVPLVQRTYGLADREAARGATTDTRFNLGSINKLFTKVAVGQLVAAGKLALTDTVGALLPDHPDGPSRRATVDQLLGHRGGIADFFGPAFTAAPKAAFRANADYYRFVARQPVRFEPGAREEYCNGCYIVLGAIVERVAGMPYETYVARHVFGPAGMSGAGWFASDALPPLVARGYTRRSGPQADGPLRRNDALHGAAGSAAGGGYATAADLLAFDTALRAGRLLDPERTAWMLQADRVDPGASGRARGGIGAAGGAPGINAALESDGVWTVVVLANLDPPSAIGVAQSIRRALGF